MTLRPLRTLVAFTSLAAACGGSVTGTDQPSVDAAATDASRAEAAPLPAAACTEEPAIVPGREGRWGYPVRLQSSGDELYWLSFPDDPPWASGALCHLSRVVYESVWASTTWVDAHDFLVLGAHAYWFGSSGLVEAAIGEDPTAVRHLGGDGRFLRTDGRRVFWWAEGRLHRLDPASNAVVALASVASPYDLAVDDAYAYWVEKRGARWSLFRASAEPAGGSDVEMILDDTGGPTSRTLSVDATHVYFWTGHDQGIHRVPKDGGGAPVLVGSSVDRADRFSDGMFEIAYDARSIYLVGRRTLRRITKADSKESVLAATTNVAYELTVDDHCVYWWDAGELWMRTK